jgi:hypothetical protein
VKAIISQNPEARFWGQAEMVDTIGITHVISALKQLSIMAEMVDGHPEQYWSMAQGMTMLIQDIKRAIFPVS